jgi:hypothetical protein
VLTSPESLTPIKFNPSSEKPEPTLELTTRPRRTHSPTLPSETDSTHSLPSKESSELLEKPRDTLLELLLSRPRNPRLIKLDSKRELKHTKHSKTDSRNLSPLPKHTLPRKRSKVTTFQEILHPKPTSEIHLLDFDQDIELSNQSILSKSVATFAKLLYNRQHKYPYNYNFSKFYC